MLKHVKTQYLCIDLHDFNFKNIFKDLKVNFIYIFEKTLNSSK